MSYNNLLKVGITGTAGSGSGPNSYVLTQQRLEEWAWYNRFIEMNPDLQARWEQHKTFEILNNEQLQQR